MIDLFSDRLERDSPLAERMRPGRFEDFFGQEEIVGPNSPLRQSIEEGHLMSLILWGPPGSGKTTLAYIISRKVKAYFDEFSAVSTGVDNIRKAIEQAQERKKLQDRSTVVFIDEIHRFNKAQQDILLPWVERGVINLIGATTENPSFEVISPLLSRSAVYILKPLSSDTLVKIINRAIKDGERGLGQMNLKIEPRARDHLVALADGDARVALNNLEFAAYYFKDHGRDLITYKSLVEILKHHALRYDKKGEEHYNLISAYIKCLRDSDVDAALYWLARMVESGEDPKFIARRLAIFASEDVGNSDPQAIILAGALIQVINFVGFPEAQINLAQATTYLAKAPKSRSSYEALMQAKQDARKGSFGVPMHLRNPVTKLMKRIGYGKIKDKGESNFPKEINPGRYYHE